MSTIRSKINNSQIADCIFAIADKDGIDSESLFSLIESEIANEVSKNHYGNLRIAARIDRQGGSITLFRRLLVVDAENFEKEESEVDAFFADRNIYQEDYDPLAKPKYEGVISLEDAMLQYQDQEHKIGAVVIRYLPPLESGYFLAKIIKHKIERSVSFLARKKQCKAYKPRIGTIVTGIVKKSYDTRVTRNSVIIDLSGVEAILPASCLMQNETFRVGERVKCAIKDVEFSLVRPQVVLSRASNEFLNALLLQQVPELYDQVVFVKSIARDPGSRAKIAVYSTDRNIDAVGSCVGIRGNRINAVSAELNGEKIDVVDYSSDLETFIANAIKPIKHVRVNIDEERKEVDLILPEDSLSLVIGKKGQNIRLLSSLVDCKINVLSDSDVSKKKMEEFAESAALLAESLNTEEVIAQLLITEGFSTVDSIAASSVLDLSYIEGFDKEIAEEIHKRAIEFVDLRRKKFEDLFKQYSIDDLDIINIQLNCEDMKKLFSSGVKTLKDLAALSLDEFLEIVGEDCISHDLAENVIMGAREKLGWFNKE